MTAAPLDLLVLGDCNPDLILSAPALTPVFGQVETLVDRSELTIGGSGAIMACAAARLGLRTAIAGVVGDDLFGHYMVDSLLITFPTVARADRHEAAARGFSGTS